MGWLELNAWLEVWQRQVRPPEPDPGSFQDQRSQENFAELHRERERLRGR
jgi:hypothetical protein